MPEMITTSSNAGLPPRKIPREGDVSDFSVRLALRSSLTPDIRKSATGRTATEKGPLSGLRRSGLGASVSTERSGPRRANLFYVSLTKQRVEPRTREHMINARTGSCNSHNLKAFPSLFTITSR